MSPIELTGKDWGFSKVLRQGKSFLLKRYFIILSLRNSGKFSDGFETLDLKNLTFVLNPFLFFYVSP